MSKSKSKTSRHHTPNNPPPNSKKATNSLKGNGTSADRRDWPLIIAAVLAILGLTYLYQRQNSQQPAPEGISITAEQAYQKYNEGVFLLDVRDFEEWSEIHIPNTTFILLDELGDRLTELPKNEEIVVVCRSGNRSQEGRDILQKNGFTQVSSMDGGVKDWQAAGYPTTTGP